MISCGLIETSPLIQRAIFQENETERFDKASRF
jgi:hypothetical protein